MYNYKYLYWLSSLVIEDFTLYKNSLHIFRESINKPCSHNPPILGLFQVMCPALVFQYVHTENIQMQNNLSHLLSFTPLLTLNQSNNRLAHYWSITTVTVAAQLNLNCNKILYKGYISHLGLGITRVGILPMHTTS